VHPAPTVRVKNRKQARQRQKMLPRTVGLGKKIKLSLSAGRSFALLAIFFVSSAGRILALDPTNRISQYGHSVWRLQDGYFGGAVFDVTQTADGYIWVSSENALYRFDGVSFVQWIAQSDKKSILSHVTGLQGVRDGSLWMRTNDDLAHVVNGQLLRFQENEGWTVLDLIQDKDGEMWFSRSKISDVTHFLCHVVDSGVRCYGREDGLEVTSAERLFARDSSGAFWMGDSTEITRWRPGESRTVFRPQSLHSNEGNLGISALVPETDGSVWVGMAISGRGAGLQRLVNGTFQPFRSRELNGETLEVLCLLKDRQNSLWVGTTQGLYKIHGTKVDHYGTADGLSSDYVNWIFEDREGNLWVTTTQGLDMFRDLRVRSISKRQGLIEDGVESVAASRDGSVWIGTGRLQMLGPRGISLGPGSSLPGNLVTSLFVDHADRLWMGFMNRLYVNERGSLREVTKRDGSALGMAMGITEDKEYNMWVETRGTSRDPPGTLVRIQNLKVTEEFPSPAMPFARKIVADLHGGIWLGQMTGNLALYRDGQISDFKFANHPNSRVVAMTATPDGSILGATDFGVVGRKDGKQQILTVQNGLPCNTVTALISDDAGNLWLLAQCGLIEIPKEQMQLWWENAERKLTMRVFDALDGVQAGLGHFSSSAKTPDGRLWFANGIVLQVVDPAHISDSQPPPPVRVEQIIADRRSYSPQTGLTIPPRTRDLEIDYTALRYAAPQKVRFRYKLENRDADWQEPGTRRQAFYSDLRPGSYRFHVIACNDDGVWNESGASLSFSVLPAYYQTSWFRAACGGVFLLLLWAIYEFRVRQLRQQFAIALDARVQERTRIARELHDTLLQSFQGLMLRFQTVEEMLPARPMDAKEALEGALLRADQAIGEGRDAITDIRTSTLASHDLAQSMTALMTGLNKEFAEGNGGSPTFRVLVEGAPRAVRPILQDEIYRIARELLRNAFRHALARNIETEITYGESLRLRFRDDGKGIDPSVVKRGGRSGHWGLPGIRERAKQIGAQLQVWSELGAGTEVELNIPGSVAYEGSSPTRTGFRLFRKRTEQNREHRS
jgi:signal transduction histidine kinase/ligand-binding sensor domain-containing protein